MSCAASRLCTCSRIAAAKAAGVGLLFSTTEAWIPGRCRGGHVGPDKSTLFAQGAQLHARDNANHDQVLSGASFQPDTTPDRILARPVTLGELVIHDDHAVDIGAVLFREEAPTQKLHPQERANGAKEY